MVCYAYLPYHVCRGTALLMHVLYRLGVGETPLAT